MLRSSTLTKIASFALAIVTVMAFAAPQADARAGVGISTGSRGLKTFTPPPTTKTAPNVAKPMERTAQQPAAANAARPGTAAASAPARSPGFMTGLLGAGLFGALLGAGLFGGLGSLSSILGLLLQVALIGGVIYLALAFWRSRSQSAMANGPAAGPAMADSYQRASLQPEARPSSAGAGPVQATAPLNIAPDDFSSFERLLSVVQLAYSRQDTGALRAAATPEMVGYFDEQIARNKSHGYINEVGVPTLLSGDLAEAWSEAGAEYATVAMTFSMTDALVEAATGKVLEGSRTKPEEVTELWTFTRRSGGTSNAWRLSAIQQTA